MKKLSVLFVVMALVLTLVGQAFANGAVTGTDVSGTDVSGTDITGTNVSDTNVSDTDVLENGDVNGDDKIDAGDALVILKAAVGKEVLTDAQKVAADTYVDGKIDAVDALQVLLYAVDKVDTLPVYPDGAVVTGTDVTDTDVTATNA